MAVARVAPGYDKLKRMRALISFVTAGSVAVLTLAIPNPGDTISFLDIGQGDAILLQRGTAQVLIDGGAGNAVLTRLGEELPYFDRTIEVVIATHPDRDHLEGLLHVLEKYQVKLIVLPRVAHTSQLQAEWLTRLHEAVVARNIEYRFAQSGQHITAGKLALRVLHPATAASAVAGKTNNASVVTRVDFSGLSLLLSGDAEATIERELVQNMLPRLLDVAIIKAGHHGSKTSTDTTWLAATTPHLAVVSVGKDNSFGHPHPTILARLAALKIPVVRTDQVGTIRFKEHAGEWLLTCGARTLFPTRQKSCMKET